LYENIEGAEYKKWINEGRISSKDYGSYFSGMPCKRDDDENDAGRRCRVFTQFQEERAVAEGVTQ